MKTLNIVDTAYRATLEEQDDTALWFIHAIAQHGAKSDILLSGNAVNYLVKHQNPQPISFGSHKIHFPNKFHEDLENLNKQGTKLFFIKDDLNKRGISDESVYQIAEGIEKGDIANLISNYDNVWHW